MLNESRMEASEVNGDDKHTEDDCTFTLKTRDYCSNLLLELERCRHTNSGLTDTVLCVGQLRIPAHRAVLAASSPYFRAMFSCSLKESRQSQIELSGVEPWTVRVLVEYSYLGTLHIHVETAQELLSAASMLQFPEVVKACSALLARFLTPLNCLGLEEFAATHACDSLQQAARCYALENFEEVLDNDEILQLSEKSLVNYLSCNDLDVPNEDCVLMGVLRWTNHDRQNRLTTLPLLLSHVRLRYINKRNLETVLRNSAVQQCSVSQQHVLGALHQLTTPVRPGSPGLRPSVRPASPGPRPSTVARQLVMVIGGVDEQGEMLSSCEIYDPHKERWTLVDELPQKLQCFSAAVLDHCVYVTGGYQLHTDGRLQASTCVWCFDTRSRCWSNKCRLLTPRACHTSVALGSHLVVLGGVSAPHRRDALEQLEAYNPATNSWHVAGRAPLPRRGSSAVALGNGIVEVGGLLREASVNTMNQYQLKEGSEFQLEYVSEQFVLPEPLQYSHLFSVDGSNFLILWEDSRSLIELNPSKRTFRQLAAMNASHVQGGAALINDSLFVCGGWNNQKPSSVPDVSLGVPSNSVEVYRPDVDKWDTLTELRLARAHHVCITFNV